MRNMQEDFDTVITHLVNQGKRSIDSVRDMCLYRSEDGLKCAIGCLIPDDRYNPSIEDRLVTNSEFLKFFPEFALDATFYCELQSLHDDFNCGYKSKSFHRRVISIAEEYDLSLDKIKHLLEN